jgi:class 3 adenylate cyclase/tetratricopeptide (TPR) repeat protein
MDSDQISFGQLRLDLRRRELLRDDRPVRIGGRTLDILCVLASAGGDVVSKDELMARVWPNRIIEEGNIHVHISALRKVLDEHGDGHSYVVTVPGRGYRLGGLAGSKSAGLNDLRVRPRTIERRQLTVIACELVGAARLAARLDPGDLSAVVAAFYRCCSETVVRFGGMVTRLAGDEMLAYFGYPQAQEHDAEQAIRAALALVVDVRRFGTVAEMVQLRLGIATGPVVVGDLIGGDASDNGNLIGETVNLAASLRRIAEPNKVVIGAGTRRLLGDLFEVREIRNLRLGGVDGTIEAYEVLRPSTIDSRFEALHGSSLTPLVGREEEIELLLRRWQQAKAGQMRVVLVTGEPGIGKSRLCVELQRRLQGESHTSLRYFCSPHHQDSALYPIIRQFESAAGFERSDTAESKVAKLKAVVAQETSSTEASANLNLLAEMLTLPSSGVVFPVGDTSPRKRNLTFEALIRQIDATAARRPVLMVFEDAHWSDPTTLELLELLVKRAAQWRILLLITFRPEFAAPWTGHAGVTTLTLSRLDRRDGAALVQRAVGENGLPSDIVEKIAERTDGIPLFLEELSKAIVESGVSPAHAIELQSPIAIPETLQASLMARLDRVDTAAKEVAQVGAAIGREFPYELLAEVCGRTVDNLDTALERLVASGLTFRRGVPPNTIFLFKHGLVQDAIYSTLLRNNRRQLHANIAEALERIFPETLEQHPELLAHHLSAAERPEIAIRYWRLAVERALRASAYREAIGHCTRGLQVIEAIADRDQRLHAEVSLQLQRGIALTASLGPSEPAMLAAFARAREIAEELGEDRTLAAALLGLWAHHNARANLRPALALAQRLFAIGESRGEKALCVQAHSASLTVSYKMGAFATAWRHFEGGTALYRPGMRVIEAIPNYTSPGPDMLLHGSFVAWVMGYPQRARNLADETMIAARKLKQPYTLTHCVYMLGHLAELQEDWVAVRRANDETVELATRWGFTGTKQLVARRIALVTVVIDRDEEQFRFKCEHRQPGFARALHDVVLARTCGLSGTPEQGLKLLEEALAVTQECGSCFYDAEVYRTRGQLLASLRNWTEAETSYCTSIDIARRQGARMWELRAATDLARLWAERGNRRRAFDLLSSVYGWFTEGLDTQDLRAARAVLDNLERIS